MMRRTILPLSLILALLPWSTTPAQGLRYELGRRLRQLETTWQDTPVTAELARKRALPRIQEAVGLFFGFKLRAAGDKLDQATHALRTDGPWTPELQLAHSLSVTPPSRLLELSDEETPLTIKRFYKTPAQAEASSLRIRLSLKSGAMLLAEQEFPLTSLPQTVSLPRPPSAGDFTLSWEVAQASQVLSRGASQLSFVRDLKARRARLQARTTALSAGHPDKKTAQLLLGTLTDLAGTGGSETDYPAAQLLATAEQLVAHAQRKDSWFTGRSGEAWLKLPLKGGRSGIVRTFIPEAATKSPRPLVIALHGMGGSENLWFDGYGNGAIVELCRQRGWILCAPRAPGFGAPSAQAIAEALGELCRIDMKRMYLVGHSMGAGHIGTLMNRKAPPWRALAFLGGGVRSIKPKLYEATPVYIGAGALDFGLRGARSLYEKLLGADLSPSLVFRSWPLTEHLTIVQEALPEVFEFFDRAP